MKDSVNLNLRSLRHRHCCTQAALAKALHVSRSTIAMWENGTNEPDIEQILALARFFSVSTDYLLGFISHSETDSLLNDTEKTLIALFRGMDKQGQDSTLRCMVMDRPCTK